MLTASSSHSSQKALSCWLILLFILFIIFSWCRKIKINDRKQYKRVLFTKSGDHISTATLKYFLDDSNDKYTEFKYATTDIY